MAKKVSNAAKTTSSFNSGSGNNQASLGFKIKTAIGDLMSDLTGSKKPSRFTIRDEQKLVSSIIQENNKLLQRMREIRFKSKFISEEELAKDQQKALVLMVRLESVEASNIPDTRAMDQVMYKLCDELQNAYQIGDKLTVHYIWETLTYGIATGHKPLREMEKDREAEVMAWRENKMETYLRVTQAAQNIFQCTSAVDAHTETLKKGGEDLKKALEAIDQFAQESPENAVAMEEIWKAGGHKSDLTGAIQELAGKILMSVRTFKGCESLKKQVALLKTTMNDYQTLINNMEVTLLAPNEVAKTQIMEHAKSLGNELMNRLNAQVKDIIKADAIINDYYDSVESVFQQPELQKYISSALEQFEEMQLKMQEQQKAFERAVTGAGRKKIFIPNEQIVQENEQENELDNEI